MFWVGMLGVIHACHVMSRLNLEDREYLPTNHIVTYLEAWEFLHSFFFLLLHGQVFVCIFRYLKVKVRLIS